MREHLNFKIPPKSELNYKVQIQSYRKDCHHNSNTFDYVISFRLKKETFNGYIIEITRRNVLLNKTKFHNVMNELLLVTSEILNRLELEISPSGKTLHIKNLKYIHEKWEEIRLRVESGYKGEIVHRYINPIEKIINDEQSFINTLQKDPFFRFYLSIYGEYHFGEMIRDYLVSGFPSWSKTPYTAQEINWLQKQKTKGYSISKKMIIDENYIFNIRKEVKEVENMNFHVNIGCDYILSGEKITLSLKSNQEVLFNQKPYEQIQMQAELVQ